MEQKQEKILIDLGFKKPTDDERYNYEDYFYISPEFYRESLFAVRGDHAFDIVDILYVEKTEVKGFYYSSSLVEMLDGWGYEKEIMEVFNKIKKFANREHIEIKLVKKEGFIWFVAECDLSDDWYANRCVGMLEKIAAILDIFMREIENNHYEKLRNETVD